MTWKLLHATRMLKDAGGIPDHGNQPRSGDADSASASRTPEYRLTGHSFTQSRTN
jgi:hypothetical protein